MLARVESWGWAPGSAVQFVVTDAVPPRSTFLAYPGHGGFAASPLDPANPLFYDCFLIPSLIKIADAAGVATFAFDTTGLPAGVNGVVQTVDLSTGAISTPASVAFTQYRRNRVKNARSGEMAAP